MIYFHKKELSLFNAWALCCVIIAIAYFPIINERIYFVDDITRSIKGYFGWTELGRPLSEWLAMILTASRRNLADITPLPQLLSILVLSYLSIILIKNLFNNVTVGSVLICVTVAVNPLVFGNMLYRFDSLSMTLSMLLAVVAWSKSNNGSWFLAFSCIIASLSLYQPSIAIFPLLAIIRFIQIEKTDKNALAYIFKSCIVTILSCIFYFFIVVKNTIKGSEKRADLTSNLFGNAYAGVKTAILTALDSYGHTACIILAISLLIFSCVYIRNTISIVNRMVDRSGQVTLFLAITIPLGVTICSAGVNLILNNGYYPVRVLFPIVFIVLMLLVIPASFNRKLNAVSSYLSMMLIVTSTSVIFAASSSLYHQRQYDSYILFSLSEKLSSFKSEKNTFIFGSTDYSEVSETSSRVFPIIKNLKNNYYDMTLSQSLVNNGIRNIKFSGQDREISYDLQKMACNGKMNLVYAMPQYSIFEDESSRLIYLGGHICNK